MKKLLFVLFPIVSFAQKKDSLQMNQLNPSLDFEMKQSFFKNDSINKIQFNVENYKKEAIRERRKEAQQYYQEELRKTQMRDDLLKRNQKKGK